MDCGCVGGHMCFKHKLAYWRDNGANFVAPSATPTRTPNIPVAPKEQLNSWERGIATDSRGMPILREDLSPMGVHEYASRRHEVEEGRKKLAHPTTTKDS